MIRARYALAATLVTAFTGVTLLAQTCTNEWRIPAAPEPDPGGGAKSTI